MDNGKIKHAAKIKKAVIFNSLYLNRSSREIPKPDRTIPKIE